MCGDGKIPGLKSSLLAPVPVGVKGIRCGRGQQRRKLIMRAGDCGNQALLLDHRVANDGAWTTLTSHDLEKGNNMDY